MADLKLIIPKFVGSLGRSGVGVGDYSVADIRNLQRALKAIDPKLRTQLLREAKEPAKPVQAAVKNAIPSVSPLSGMSQGRLAWQGSVDAKGRSHNPKDVKIQFRTSMSGKSLTTSLVRVRVASPAVVVADMAGKSGKYFDKGYRGSGFTREYPYKGGTRRHRVNGQGRAMVRNLGGSASRFVWPAAERSIPAARDAVDRVISKFAKMITQRGL
jgi:hypothetical protein